MTNIFESDDDLIDKSEVTNSFDTVAPYERKSDFKPWHKPRKQWVRNKQWWFHLDKLLIDYNRQFRDVECLKYFGLPGGDLLDVEFIRRSLETSTRHNNKNILMHGYISSKPDKIEAESRLAELLDAPNFDGDSKVEHLNFGSLNNENSLGWGNVKTMGPYHFINLDFCDCVFKEETLGSIHKLMNYQLTRQLDTPWLFCVTTRMDREGVNQELIEQLDSIFTNLHSDDGVLESIKSCFEIICSAIDDGLTLSSPEIEPRAFSELLQVCFILWTVAYSLEHSTKVSLVSSMKYTIKPEGETPDMFSLVFRFKSEDTLIPDSSGLVPVAAVSSGLTIADQIELKLEAVTRLADSMDIDVYLGDNESDLQSCIEESKALLEQCGWDTTNYERDVCL